MITGVNKCVIVTTILRVIKLFAIVSNILGAIKLFALVPDIVDEAS